MRDDAGGWRDLPICPPCLLRDHAHCDGGRFWCECQSDICVPEPAEESE